MALQYFSGRTAHGDRVCLRDLLSERDGPVCRAVDQSCAAVPSAVFHLLLSGQKDSNGGGLYQCLYRHVPAGSGGHPHGRDVSFYPYHDGGVAGGFSGFTPPGAGSHGNQQHPPPCALLEYLLVPFLLRCSEVVDEMSVAFMARSFDKDWSRTNYLELKLGVLDWVLIPASLAVTVWNLAF